MRRRCGDLFVNTLMPSLLSSWTSICSPKNCDDHSRACGERREVLMPNWLCQRRCEQIKASFALPSCALAACPTSDSQLFPVSGSNKLTAEQLLKKQLRSFDVDPSKDRIARGAHAHTQPSRNGFASIQLHLVTRRQCDSRPSERRRDTKSEAFQALVKCHHKFHQKANSNAPHRLANWWNAYGRMYKRPSQCTLT